MCLRVIYEIFLINSPSSLLHVRKRTVYILMPLKCLLAFKLHKLETKYFQHPIASFTSLWVALSALINSTAVIFTGQPKSSLKEHSPLDLPNLSSLQVKWAGVHSGVSTLVASSVLSMTSGGSLQILSPEQIFTIFQAGSSWRCWR